eukprot:UN19704
MASKKWAKTRLDSSIANLVKQAFPRMSCKAAVKLENMEEGKAPRLLIADGDDGQLMALTVIKCLEDLQFKWFKMKSIKHCAKREAVERVVKELTIPGGRLIEGDGSAWDTTCSEEIRSITENVT